MVSPPTKAEILITRRCNLRCHYCGMVKDISEMPPDDWSKVPSRLKQLGIKFAPIYGAEPLLVFESLLLFIEGCSREEIPCSVITNGVLLTKESSWQLKEAGLDSITLSMDIAPTDKSTKAKQSSTREKLGWLKEVFRDIEVICTVTKHDWLLLPDFIETMSNLGIWTHFDFYHTYKNQPNSKCSGTDSNMPTKSDIRTIAGKLISMKEGGSLVHSSYDLLTYLKDHPERAVHQSWKCRPGAWITVNSDGYVWTCDDWCPPDLERRFHVLDKSWAWADLVSEFQARIHTCPGCIWGTHLMSDFWWEKENFEKEITHGRYVPKH